MPSSFYLDSHQKSMGNLFVTLSYPADTSTHKQTDASEIIASLTEVIMSVKKRRKSLHNPRRFMLSECVLVPRGAYCTQRSCDL